MPLWNPSWEAKDNAVAAAMASTSRAVYSWGICLANEAKTNPFPSQITTPTPDLFCSLKVAPSQLIFTKPRWGGRHLVWGGVAVTRGNRGVVMDWANSAIRTLAIAAIWWELTVTLFKRNRFLWVQISQAVVYHFIWSMAVIYLICGLSFIWYEGLEAYGLFNGKVEAHSFNVWACKMPCVKLALYTRMFFTKLTRSLLTKHHRTFANSWQVTTIYYHTPTK